MTKDYVLGHEASGVVVWAGKDVSNLKVGDRAAIEPGVPCGDCFQCSTGNYNLCADVQFSGAPPYLGSIRRYHVHPAKYLHKLPDNLTFADGALLEPLSVVLHGLERSPIRLGESAVICGAGPIGLIALATARLSGAFPIVITDVDAGRLKFAETFVPGCKTVQIQTDKTPEEMAAIINDTISAALGDQPRVVYECTGVQSSVVTAAYIPRPAGEVMVVGVGRPIMNELPFMHIALAEVSSLIHALTTVVVTKTDGFCGKKIDLKFINRYHHSWPLAIKLLTSGYLNLRDLVTHHFTLENSVEALTMATDRTKNAIKIHIEDGEQPN